MADLKISQLTASTTPLAGTEVLPIVQSSTTKQVSVANLTAGRAVSASSLALTGSPLPTTSGGTGLTSFTSGGVPYASSTSALATGSALTFDGTSTFKLTAAGTGYVYAYNSTAATSSVTQSSPRFGFYGAQWNSSAGNVSMNAYLQLQSLTSNTTSPTSKLSFYVAGNGNSAAEVAYVDSNANLQTYGNLVNTNTTAATSGSAPASYKCYLYRNSWNSSFGSLAQTNYIYAKNVTNNANPTTEAIIIAPADGTSSQTANEAFEFRGTGDFKMVSGNVVIGTSGKGIDFSITPDPAGMTSELLSDYEEGAWTPVVADASSGGNTGSFSYGGASYTKVGRQVTVRVYLSGVNTTGMTAGNTLFIRGLPYVSGDTAQGNFYTYRVGRDASTVSSCANIASGASVFNFSLFTTNSATTDKTILVSDIVSGTSEIQTTLTYFV